MALVITCHLTHSLLVQLCRSNLHDFADEWLLLLLLHLTVVHMWLIWLHLFVEHISQKCMCLSVLNTYTKLSVIYIYIYIYIYMWTAERCCCGVPDVVLQRTSKLLTVTLTTTSTLTGIDTTDKGTRTAAGTRRR